jgi:hypothetical protein
LHDCYNIIFISQHPTAEEHSLKLKKLRPMNALKYAFIPIIIIAIVVLFGLYNKSGESKAVLASVAPQPKFPTRWDLYDALKEHGRMLIVHDATKAAHLSRLDALASQLSQQRRWTLATELKHVDDVTEEEVQNNPLFLIGTFQENQWLQKLSKSLPIHFEDEGFVFYKKKYEHAEDVLKLSLYPHPKRAEFPLFLITGNEPESIHQVIEEQLQKRSTNLFRNNWNYEVLQRGESVVFGQFDEQNWTLDEALHFDFADSEVSSYDSPHFNFFSYSQNFRDPDLQQLSALCEATFEEILSFIGRDEPMTDIQYFIYPSAEEKGLRVNNMDEAQVIPEQNQVHVVMNDQFKGALWQMENELLLRQLLDLPETNALEKGLGVYFSRQWQKRGYSYWAQRLFQSGNLPTLQDLLDNDMLARESDLVMHCSAGSFVQFLIEKWGKASFLEKYANWVPDQKEIKKLEKEWHRFLDRQPVAEQPEREEVIPFLKGFNFAHEGYSVYNGYGSRLASQSLEKLRNIHANAVAIVPYSYMRDPNQPSFIRFSERAGSENDESVIHSHYEAQKRGLFTVLKPQIWIGRDSWPGDVAMTSEEDWKLFFENYHRWMRHYALLAEIHGFDMLCVGVEFAKATTQREQDWRDLIRKLRGIYSGPMTYAANWGEEFENLQFWDELDYIGLDCYYPLSQKEQPAKAELTQHFNRVLDLIEETCHTYNKPMIFTEIGFRSVENTWKQPHEEPLGRPFNEQCQNMCYEAVMESLQDRDFCNGLLWWKWSCNLRNRPRENTGFTPYNKLAQNTVKEWFRKW